MKGAKYNTPYTKCRALHDKKYKGRMKRAVNNGMFTTKKKMPLTPQGQNDKNNPSKQQWAHTPKKK